MKDEIKQLIEDTEKAEIVGKLEEIVNKHGFKKSRIVINRYFKTHREREKLEREIKQREIELQKLKDSI